LGPAGGLLNHEISSANKVLWKFLAEHAQMELRIVFSGEFEENSYEQIGTNDADADEYLRGWPDRMPPYS